MAKARYMLVYPPYQYTSLDRSVHADVSKVERAAACLCRSRTKSVSLWPERRGPGSDSHRLSSQSENKSNNIKVVRMVA